MAKKKEACQPPSKWNPPVPGDSMPPVAGANIEGVMPPVAGANIEEVLPPVAGAQIEMSGTASEQQKMTPVTGSKIEYRERERDSSSEERESSQPLIDPAQFQEELQRAQVSTVAGLLQKMDTNDGPDSSWASTVSSSTAPNYDSGRGARGGSRGRNRGGRGAGSGRGREQAPDGRRDHRNQQNRGAVLDFQPKRPIQENQLPSPKRQRREPKQYTLPNDAPAGYDGGRFRGDHPWAHLVDPICTRWHFKDDEVTQEVPIEYFRAIHPKGYSVKKRTRTFFPNTREVSAWGSVPILETVGLREAINFRRSSARTLDKMLNGEEVFFEDNNLPPIRGDHKTCRAPHRISGRTPVIYQVVGRTRAAVILEAKDFLVPGPDRPDLRLISVDMFCTNVLMNVRGFCRDTLSISDFVYVYSVEPTQAALRDPYGVHRDCIVGRVRDAAEQRGIFWRAAEFAVVEPWQDPIPRLGVVVSQFSDFKPKSLEVSFEGSPDATPISQHITIPDFRDLRGFPWVVGDLRMKVSYAMRFSEPAVSESARSELIDLVAEVYPAYSKEGPTSIKVFELSREDKNCLTDVLGTFRGYDNTKESSRKRLAQVVSTTAAAMSAMTRAEVDSTPRSGQVTCPNTKVYPMVLHINLSEIPDGGAWTRGTLISVWLHGNQIIRVTGYIEKASHDPTQSSLSMVMSAQGRAAAAGVRKIRDKNPFLISSQIEATVRIMPPSHEGDAAFAAVCKINLVESVLASKQVTELLDSLYSPTTPSAPSPASLLSREDQRDTFLIKGKAITLDSYQLDAIAIGVNVEKVGRIQAPFGSGKTVVGAIAVSETLRLTDKRAVLMVASTNRAVAQFAETLLGVEDMQGKKVVRIISEHADRSGRVAAQPCDLPELLKQLPELVKLNEAEEEKHQQYTIFRELVQAAWDTLRRGNLPEEIELSGKKTPEEVLPELQESLSKVLLKRWNPDVVLATTAEALSLASGLLRSVQVKTVLIDESSQVPEATLLGLFTAFPSARFLVIGDQHQLDPYVNCPEGHVVKALSRRSAVSVTQGLGVMKSVLGTTFRAHPELNTTPDTIVYRQILRSGASADQRTRLQDLIKLPNIAIPSLFIRTDGAAVRAASGSHYNNSEANAAIEVVDGLLAKGAQPGELAVICLYRDQVSLLEGRLATRGVSVHTVDSCQGSEFEITLVLTTRSDRGQFRASFFDHKKRFNVAITRCRSGRIVFGTEATLQFAPNWNQMLALEKAQGCVINVVEIPRLFEN